ncbi:hypothetical protein [Methylobacter sp. S3L5C]|uniref:hypothetical protein n=1 Tax=Methylobacter sp. S3L5C TaxID=2839024 RepID=UPI001FAC3844|nr:hypothetical protein [Methylobacter sp. S3L5C]
MNTTYFNYIRGFLNIMNFIKKTALTLFMAISLGAISTTAFAAEAVAAPAADSAASVTQTISHVEEALAKAQQGDFSESLLHIKSARESAESITGNKDVLKQANSSVIQGQIQVKQGNKEKSTVELAKALELYKSL